MANPIELAGLSALTVDLRDARRHLLELVVDLDHDRLLGPELEIVNPPLWEVGHVAWFTERWILRRVLGRESLFRDGDRLFDSTAIDHPWRWRLELPSLADTLAWAARVASDVEEVLLDDGAPPELDYFARLALFHEDMHVEAMLYTRQTLGYPPPAFLERAAAPAAATAEGEVADGDATVPGGTFLLGASGDEPFVFDNEKWAHPVELAPFRIARRAVTQGEFAAFVDDGGYLEPSFWSEEGWRWRTAEEARHPPHWRGEPSAWERRLFDRWVGLEPGLPVCHVNAFEAEAWCRWAGRRLPTEAEWEAAAALAPGEPAKRDRPWGPEPADELRANLDLAAGGTVDADAFPAGDSAAGCRQLWGNVWEWTASTFAPYPGFVRDPYAEYSEPWFGSRRVLRGGSWATRARMLRNTWRNYFTPDRRDVFAGFRSCAP